MLASIRLLKSSGRCPSLYSSYRERADEMCSSSCRRPRDSAAANGIHTHLSYLLLLLHQPPPMPHTYVSVAPGSAVQPF